MLRLKTLGLSFSTLVRKNVAVFTPLTYVPAYNFGRAGSMTQKKKEKEMEKEWNEQAKLMEEHSENESDGEEENLNEEELLEERKLEEEMDSIEYDAQLDKMILDQLNAGKSEEQIIREFFGQGTFGQKQPPGGPKGKKAKEVEEIDHNPDKVSIFEASKYFDGLFSDEKTPEQRKGEKKFFAEVRLMEDLNKIVGGTDKEPLDRLGRSDYQKLGNKLSKWEKNEMMLENAIMQGQILATGKAPPKGAKPTLIVKERGVHEEFDLAKDREEFQKKMKLEELGIYEAPEEEDLPDKVQDEESTELATPAIQYETPEEKRIRLKTETSITQSKKTTDVAFKKGAEGDLVQSAKDMDLYVPEAKAGDSRLAVFKESGTPPVTQRLHKEAVAMAERFDLDLDFTKELMKEHLFKLKHLEEENLERAENQKKREKRKKVSKLLQELENAEVSKTFDFEDNINVEEITRMNKLSKKGILDIEDIKSLDDDVTLGVQGAEESMNIKGGRSYEIHRLQTQKNVENYVNTLFNSNKQRIMVGVQNKVPILITDVILNPAVTVVNIFWTALDQHMQAIDKNQKIVKKMQQNLDQFAKYARGKMCRDLQFKYALEMRFYYSEVSEVYDDVVDNMEQTTPDIVEQRMKEELEKGTFNKEFDAEIRRDIIENEVETMAMQFMQDYNHSKSLKSGNKQKFDDDGKRKRNNRNEDGTKKKFKRQNAGQSFWDSLDA